MKTPKNSPDAISSPARSRKPDYRWPESRLESLKKNIANDLGGKAREIILAFNPTSLGDLQANILMKELAPLTEKISRLGRGLPTGGEIEFADDETLGSALERRN